MCEAAQEAATVSAINASTYIIKKIVSAAISQIEDVKYDTAFSRASNARETASATIDAAIDLDSFKIGAMIIIPALMIMGQYGLKQYRQQQSQTSVEISEIPNAQE